MIVKSVGSEYAVVRQCVGIAQECDGVGSFDGMYVCRVSYLLLSGIVVLFRHGFMFVARFLPLSEIGARQSTQLN